MKENQTGISEALKFAIQMELDGKKYYVLAGKESANKAGKELYSWLAEQEDQHRQRFEDIYKSIAADKGWPVTGVKPDRDMRYGTLFGKAIKSAGKSIQANQGEIEAAGKAIEMEIKSRDYYKNQAEKSPSDIERKFFTSISAEEQGHYLALIDYKEYISDPDGWFTRTEHHLLDGA